MNDLEKNQNECGMDVVDIGNFCLLENKYKKYLEEKGQTVSDNSEILKECSDSISQLLSIMDGCQKILYKTGYKEENIEDMKKCEAMFRDGVETLTKLMGSFAIATEKLRRENDLCTMER